MKIIPSTSSNCESYNIKVLRDDPIQPHLLDEGEDEENERWGDSVDRRVAVGAMAS